MINVAINGFGRIGRLVLRAGITDPNIRFVAINDLAEPSTLSHLLRYDSVHGPFKHNLMAFGKTIQAKGQDIQVFAERDPENLPWQDLDIDVVIESTGFFRTKEGMQKHLKAGAHKVLLSAPGKGDDKEGVKTLVMGVNEHEYNNELMVSNASCTTNCFAPMAKVLNDNYGIEGGVMTTVHAYTGDQKIHDAPHSDLRRGKAAALNIVPTSTGAAKAVMEVIPQLKGRLVASAIRVPVADGSLVNFVAEISKKNTPREEVNELFRNVANHHMKGFLEYSEESLVSTDIIGNPHSCIFDSQLTSVVDNEMVIVTGWYDNEWGYSNRMIDMIKFIMNNNNNK
jgi:glyceraldehyde 3-phosphate dehydrogenase